MVSWTHFFITKSTDIMYAHTGVNFNRFIKKCVCYGFFFVTHYFWEALLFDKKREFVYVICQCLWSRLGIVWLVIPCNDLHWCYILMVQSWIMVMSEIPMITVLLFIISLCYNASMHYGPLMLSNIFWGFRSICLDPSLCLRHDFISSF